MCLGETGVVVEVLSDGHALVRFEDASIRAASLVVPTVEGIQIACGDRVVVAVGMVLRRESPPVESEHR